MAAKKKAASKTKPKRPPAKPKRKASPAPKRAQPKAQPSKAQPPKAAKKAKARAVVVTKPPKAEPMRSPERVAVAPSPPVSCAVRPGLQKRPDATLIGVVSVTDGGRLIEQSTFYTAAGRDEYVQRWEARGYTCSFTPLND
jgi:hypothetical protein